MFKEQVLRSAKIHQTKVFILSNQYSDNSKKYDTYALLASKAIHEFDPTSKIYVQLVNPEFLMHIWADWDIVMSTQALKMGIIAQNVFNQGFNTFISSLVTSSSLS